jgi:NAD(P)-dependent dehydrogenase (short-subunit alcohol dehydrogenase family)
MHKLSGETVLIAGGAGEVGEGLVRQFLRAGARVVVPSRKEKRLDQLRGLLADENVENLITKHVDVGSLDGVQALRDSIDVLHHVVSSLGGWWQGMPLTDIPLEQWHDLIHMGLHAHFILAKTFLPAIREQSGSSYTFINGGGALHPVAMAGPVSVSAAAQLMLQKVLVAEHETYPVRINTLILATPVKTRSRGQTPPNWISADEAGKYCVALAQGDTSGKTIIFDDAKQLPDAD